MEPPASWHPFSEINALGKVSYYLAPHPFSSTNGPVNRAQPAAADAGGCPVADSLAAQRESKLAAAFSAIIMVGALVLPPMSLGMTEASITRKPSTPRTLNSQSTTDVGSLPMRHDPTGW